MRIDSSRCHRSSGLLEPMMVGIMASYSKEGLAGSAKSATELPPKLHRLRNLHRYLQGDASVFLTELLPLLLDLLSDQFGAVRKFVAECRILGEIGLKHVEYLPEIVPLLIKSLNDEAPAVARVCILLSWMSFLNPRGHGWLSSRMKYAQWLSSGIKLCAMKFVEALILLYTPDPSGSSESPCHEGPLLKIGDLSVEASQKLGLLLDQLRHPAAKSLNSSTIIVLINRWRSRTSCKSVLWFKSSSSFPILFRVQSLISCKEASCKLWTNSACSTELGFPKLSQRSACSSSKSCPGDCISLLLEMHTTRCCTGIVLFLSPLRI